jgi:hypothetical protein
MGTIKDLLLDFLLGYKEVDSFLQIATKKEFSKAPGGSIYHITLLPGFVFKEGDGVLTPTYNLFEGKTDVVATLNHLTLKGLGDIQGHTFEGFHVYLNYSDILSYECLQRPVDRSA